MNKKVINSLIEMNNSGIIFDIKKVLKELNIKTRGLKSFMKDKSHLFIKADGSYYGSIDSLLVSIKQQAGEEYVLNGLSELIPAFDKRFDERKTFTTKPPKWLGVEFDTFEDYFKEHIKQSVINNPNINYINIKEALDRESQLFYGFILSKFHERVRRVKRIDMSLFNYRMDKKSKLVFREDKPIKVEERPNNQIIKLIDMGDNPQFTINYRDINTINLTFKEMGELYNRLMEYGKENNGLSKMIKNILDIPIFELDSKLLINTIIQLQDTKSPNEDVVGFIIDERVKYIRRDDLPVLMTFYRFLPDELVLELDEFIVKHTNTQK